MRHIRREVDIKTLSHPERKNINILTEPIKEKYQNKTFNEILKDNKLSAYSVYYKEFANVLQVRTVSAEYLIAMKLMAGRKYKHDLSDIVGILSEHEKQGNPITFEMINKAVTNLYGNWEALSSDSRDFIEGIMEKGNFEQLYKAVSEEEKKSKETLIEFQENYPGVTTTENVDSILSTLKKRQISKDEILSKLKSKNDQ